MPKRTRRPRGGLPWCDRRENGVYYAFWWDSSLGRTERQSLGTKDPAEAQAAFALFLQEGRDVIRGKPSLRLTVCDAIDQYLSEHVDKRCAAPERQHYAAAPLKTFFADTAMSDIDAPLSQEYARWRGVAPGTTRRELNMLVAAANHARRRKRLPADEMPMVELPHVPGRGRAEFFTVEDIKRLMDESSGKLHAFIVLAYFTGARRESVESLEVSQIDLENRVIYFHKHGRRETSKRRAIASINDQMEAQIRLLMALTETKYLFGAPTEFYHRFKKLCARLGIDGHPHMLRHSRATHLLHDGVSRWKVAKLLGDSPDTVERVYGHHSPDYARETVASTDRMLGA